MTRVALLTGEYPPDEGGVADYTACLAEALAAKGARVDVIAPRTVSAEARDMAALEGEAVTEGVAPGRMERPGAQVHRVLPPWRFTSLGAVRRVVRQLRPDVVHLQYQTAAYAMHPVANLLPGWLRRWTGVAAAITYHDLRVPYLFPKAGGLRGVVTRWPARAADLAIVTNAEDERALAAWRRARRLALVPIGSNVADEPPVGYERGAWRRAAGIPDQAALLAYFGFLNASKGGRTLLTALEQLREEGLDARLVMIGGRVGASDPTNEGYLADFEAEAAERGLAKALLWTGHVPAAEVSAWLRAADVLTLPYADGASYRRGSLLAALAHGRPTVTTHRPGGPAGEVAGGAGLPPLVDGASARLVPPGDGVALASAARGLLEAPARARALGEGARAVAASFGWPAIAARHLALYQEILGRDEKLAWDGVWSRGG